MIYLSSHNLIYIGIFFILPLILSIYSQVKVTSTFNKYSKVNSISNITASTFAKTLLTSAGISDITITKCSGYLTDHFHPTKKYVALSDSVYNSSSIASLGVATHEIGHVLQYKNNYLPIKIRRIIQPILNFSSRFMWLILISTLVNAGEIMIIVFIGIYTLSFLFSLLTLPIEKNASKRALNLLKETNTLNSYELAQAKEVLDAAALTYVASLVSSLLVLLRLLLIFNKIRRD